MTYNIAVAGATTTVGRDFLNALWAHDFPVGDLIALGTSDQLGKQVSFGDEETFDIEPIENFDFSRMDLVFFMGDEWLSGYYSSRAARSGAVVIDLSKFHAGSPTIPVICLAANEQQLETVRRGDILRCAGSLTIQLCYCLAPLIGHFDISHIFSCALQPVSSQGQAGMDELFRQTRAILTNDSITKTQFHKQIAFNVIPQVGEFAEDHRTLEELLFEKDTRVLLGDHTSFNVSCIHIPVFLGSAQSITLLSSKELDIPHIERLWRAKKALDVISSSPENYHTPLDCVGEEKISISRIRPANVRRNGITFWSVADNIHTLSSLHALRVAEKIVAKGLK